MYVLPVISANSSLAHDSIYIDKTGGKIILYDMPANTAPSQDALHARVDHCSNEGVNATSGILG